MKSGWIWISTDHLTTSGKGSLMEAILTYDSVEVSYNGTPVLQDISFSLQPGEILGIVGESGSGKSTLVKTAMNLLGQGGLVTRGDIWFQGKNLPDLSPREMRKIYGAGIGMIFQETGAYLCPIRTIGSQIHESLRAHGRTTRGQSDRRALKLFNKLGFRDGQRILNSYCFELSGGMNQRVGIAMAMLHNPPLLLADEPTSALDVSVQKQIVAQMLHLRELYGTAIVLVTHNIGVISAMADSVIVLKDGCMGEYGPAGQVLNYPEDSYTKTLLAAVPKLRRH
jgi:ABC-type dipeptide/oligopeptide/nickel transport system ATPase component